MNVAHSDVRAPCDAAITLDASGEALNHIIEKTAGQRGKDAVSGCASPQKHNNDSCVAVTDDMFDNNSESAPSIVSEEMAPKLSPVFLENDAVDDIEDVFLFEDTGTPGMVKDSGAPDIVEDSDASDHDTNVFLLDDSTAPHIVGDIDAPKRLEDSVLSEDDGTPDLLNNNVDSAAVQGHIVPKTALAATIRAHIPQPALPEAPTQSPKNAHFGTYGRQQEDVEDDDATAAERATVRQYHPKGSLPNVQEYHNYFIEDDDDDPTPTQMQFEALHRARADMLQRSLVREKVEDSLGGQKLEDGSDDEYGDAESQASQLSSTAPSSSEGALEKIKDNLEWYQTNVGQDHPLTLSQMAIMAEAEHRAGRVTEAAHRYRIVVNEREKNYPEHPDTWRIVTDFALLQMERAKFAFDDSATKSTASVKKTLLVEAEQLLRKAVAGFALCYGNDHEDYWRAKHNLVIILLQRNYTDDALELARMVYERYSVLFGVSSPLTVDAAMHYAIALLKASHYKDTRIMLDHCRATIKKLADRLDAKKQEALCKYVSGSLLVQDKEAEHWCGADNEVEDAFMLSEHVQEARAVLTVVRKKWLRGVCIADMCATVGRVMRHMALLVMLRRHKNTTYGDFPDGEMFKWLTAVTRVATCLMADDPVKNAAQAEELYRTALKGYQRLHTTVEASLGGPATHLQKLYERRSMAVLQQLGDCLATQKTHKASLLEAEDCWHRVIYTPQISNQFALNNPTSDPVYRSAYALSHRLVARGQVSEAYSLFRRFILTPLLVYRHVTQRGTSHRTPGHPDPMYQVGVIARAVEFLLAMGEDVEVARLLESIIDESAHTDASGSECVMRAMLLMTLADAYKSCNAAEDVAEILRLVKQERHRWVDSLVVVVTRHVERSGRQVPMMWQILRTIKKDQVLRGLPPLGFAHFLLNNIAANAGEWYPETQNCERVVRLADQLLSGVLKNYDGKAENDDVVDEWKASDDDEECEWKKNDGAPRTNAEDSTELGETEDKDGDDGSGREELESHNVTDCASDDTCSYTIDDTDVNVDDSSITTQDEMKKLEDDSSTATSDETNDQIAQDSDMRANALRGCEGECAAQRHTLCSEEAVDVRVDAGIFTSEIEKPLGSGTKKSCRRAAFLGWTSIVNAARHKVSGKALRDGDNAGTPLNNEARAKERQQQTSPHSTTGVQKNIFCRWKYLVEGTLHDTYRQVPEDDAVSVQHEHTCPHSAEGRGKEARRGWSCIIEAMRHAASRKVSERAQVPLEKELSSGLDVQYEHTVPHTMEGKGQKTAVHMSTDGEQNTEQGPALLRATAEDTHTTKDDVFLMDGVMDKSQELVVHETLCRVPADKSQKLVNTETLVPAAADEQHTRKNHVLMHATVDDNRTLLDDEVCVCATRDTIRTVEHAPTLCAEVGHDQILGDTVATCDAETGEKKEKARRGDILLRATVDTTVARRVDAEGNDTETKLDTEALSGVTVALLGKETIRCATAEKKEKERAEEAILRAELKRLQETKGDYAFRASADTPP